MKVAIIGAGPAGLTAAYELAKRNIAVDIYEASDSVGGMAKTIPLWNQRVDLGPHRFFSTDARVNRLWLEIMGRDYSMVNRITRIYYKNKFFPYPLKAAATLLNLGIFEAVSCVASYLKQRIFAKRDTARPDQDCFEGWVVSRFGRRLFEIFFKTYTEKLWGIPCNALDSDFAAQRIRSLTLFEVIKNAVQWGKGNQHRTLVELFAYPNGGTGTLYEKMAIAVKQKGNPIHLNTPVKRVLVNDRRATGIELFDGTLRSYDHIISTMPMTQLIAALPGTPQWVRDENDSLKFRNTVLVYLQIQGKDLFPDNWLYVHSPDLQMGRITNFRNWSPTLYGDESSTIVSVEYWCNDDEPLWRADDDLLIELATAEMVSTGLLKGAPVLQGKVVRVPKCYPVYRLGYKGAVKRIGDYLKQFTNLSLIGRYGSFKYNNQDHSILMGILAAENLTSHEKHEIWEINSDYDYQEKSLIADTGLVVEGLAA